MQELGSLSDLELIRRNVAAPSSAEGREARALLDYRAYQAVLRQNLAIVRLTIVLTIFALVQALAAAMQSYLMYQESVRSPAAALSATTPSEVTVDAPPCVGIQPRPQH